MKQHQAEDRQEGPRLKPCVICSKMCQPWGFTSEGNHICGVEHQNQWYSLTLEERQRREHAASQRAG